MNGRKWTIWISSGLLILMGITGYFAIAADSGSREDPVVTLSYINDVIGPQTIQEIDAIFEEKKGTLDEELDKRLNDLSGEMDRMAAQYRNTLAGAIVSDAVVDQIAQKVVESMGGSGGGSASSTASWSVVQIEAGKTLTGSVGCEVILRIGAATCVASGTPGIINLSDGTDLANGGELKTNNLYIVTVNGRGVASSGGCTVLVSGSYTIS